jgi:membrane protein DedA with SNARE-associated domain
MREAMDFLVRHGPAVLFLIVLAEQLGLPLPAPPLLMAMGALAATGHFTLARAVLLALVACLIADLVWFELGRRRGARVLNLLCRVSLEPDSCVRTTQSALAGRGARVLLYAKFVPGLSTVAPPVAGLIGMSPLRFLAWDTAGALLWSGAYIALGYAFGPEIERLVGRLSQAGGRVFLLALVCVALYLSWKYLQRRRFLREIEMDRVTPEELRGMMDAGREVVLLDLRGSADAADREGTLPGAFHLPPDALDERFDQIPKDREVILFCT